METIVPFVEVIHEIKEAGGDAYGTETCLFLPIRVHHLYIKAAP